MSEINISVYELKLTKIGELKGDFPERIMSPNDGFKIVNHYIGGYDREHFIMIGLNTKNKVISINTVSIGTLNSTLVHPREVFIYAIKNKCASIIVAHNHPSGEPTPSPEDIEMTSRLKEAGEIIGIELLDHLIIGEDCFVSLNEQGMM